MDDPLRRVIRSLAARVPGTQGLDHEHAGAFVGAVRQRNRVPQGHLQTQRRVLSESPGMRPMPTGGEHGSISGSERRLPIGAWTSLGRVRTSSCRSCSMMFIAISDFGRIFATMITVTPRLRMRPKRRRTSTLRTRLRSATPHPRRRPAGVSPTTTLSTPWRPGRLQRHAGQPNTNFDAGSTTCPTCPGYGLRP